MGQSITIKIGNVDYPLVAADPEQEQLMRLAAEDVNRMLAKYDARFPDKSLDDKLAFVALQEAVGKYSNRRNLTVITDEVNALQADLENYLKNK